MSRLEDGTRGLQTGITIKKSLSNKLFEKGIFIILQLMVNGLYLYYMINQAIDHYVIMAQEIDLSITTITQRLLRTIL